MAAAAPAADVVAIGETGAMGGNDGAILAVALNGLGDPMRLGGSVVTMIGGCGGNCVGTGGNGVDGGFGSGMGGGDRTGGVARTGTGGCGATFEGNAGTGGTVGSGAVMN